MDFAKLFNADGRIPRKDWIIWIVAIAIIFGIIAWILGDRAQWVQGALSIIAGIAGIFMGIKRLHDLDKSGWLYLLGIIPIVNFFFAIYLIAFKGTDGDKEKAGRVVAVRREPTRAAACVPAGVLEALRAPAREFVDLAPIGAPVDEIAEVKLQGERERPLEMAREESGWHLRAPEDRKVEADAGRALVQALSVRYPSDPRLKMHLSRLEERLEKLESK